MFLSPDEIQALTDKVRPSAQMRELDHLKIPYKIRRDGSLVVVRAHVEYGAKTEREPRLRFG